MSSSKVQRSHRDMYKARTPPWKETYRKRCLDRVRDNRWKLISRYRKLPEKSASFVEELIKEEGESLREEHEKQALDDADLQCDIKDNKDRNQTYSCMYIPQMEGEYRVIIKFGEKEINRSPFKVLVEGAAGDASKVTAAGPGLEKTGVVVSKKTYFEVFTKGQPLPGGSAPGGFGRSSPGKLPSKGTDAGKGSVEVSIMDPSGHRDHCKATITTGSKEGVYMVEYTPNEVGLYSINISFSGSAIPKSPFGVNVGAAINSKAVYATGRGIQPRGVRVNQKAEFRVHTKEAGKAEVKIQIIGPGGAPIKCDCKPSKTDEGVYECLYIPPKIGQYVINVTFGGQHITKSPFRVDVGPEKFTKVVAFGPGLEGGVVNPPACFTVETNGETGALGFSIEGPSQAKIDCKDNGDGSADVTYWPTSPGEYAVHIMCNEEDIPQAPYMAQIQPATTAFDASKCTLPTKKKSKKLSIGKPGENPVNALHNHAQRMNQILEFDYSTEFQQPGYKVTAIFNDERFPAVCGPSKKNGRTKACANVLKVLANRGQYFYLHTKQMDQQHSTLQRKLNEIEENIMCSICMDRKRDMAFLCGHTVCSVCGEALKICHMCREPIRKKILLHL